MRTVAAALAAATSASAPAAERTGAPAGRRLVKPPRVKQGALVGLIAPGGVAADPLIEKCVANLEALGLRVKPAKNLRAAYGGYAGTVAQRIEDLHDMFRDREVSALWAVRGGSGCTALLPKIDYELVRRSPKALVGYSDITALHLAMLHRAGLVTFHGPVASSTFSDYSVENLRAVLMEPRAQVVYTLAEENLRKAAEQPQFAPRTYRPGRAQGRLVGGNLSTVCALLGTPYAPEADGSLLFLEEIGEAPYRIDRMLTQLRQSRVLSRAAGIVLGVFQKCEATDAEPSLTLAQTLEGQFADAKVPAVYGYSFGHIAHQMTLPVGAIARLDTEERTLTLLEPAVVA